jgi:hypothetical protein
MATYLYDTDRLSDIFTIRKLKNFIKHIKLNNLKEKYYKKMINKKIIENKDDILICKENYLDQQKFTSRKVVKIDTINNCLFKDITVNLNDEIGFGIFLKSEAINYSDILIDGYYQYNNQKIQFTYNIEKKVLKNLYRPTYWLDIVLAIPSELFNKKISVFINNIDTTKNEELFLSNNILYKHKPKKPKLVLVLSLDAVSDIDIKDYQDSLFPSFKNLENQGFTKFDNSISSSTLTATSAASLLTGVPLSKHMMFDYDKPFHSDQLKKVSSDLKLISEVLSDENYYTSAITTFSRWRPHSGFSRGFNEYINFCQGAIHNSSYKSKMFKVLSKAQKHNVFALFHLPGAHPPYDSKINNYTDNNLKNVYLETLKNNDSLIKQIISYLKEMEILDDSLIFISSDHGRGIEYGGKNSYQFYEERLRVPLYIKSFNSNLKQNKNAYISSHTYMYKTILENLNIENKHIDETSKFQGISWVSETFNYKTKKSIGIVGYGLDYKFVVYLNFNTNNYDIGSIEDIKAYKIVDFKVNDNVMERLDEKHIKLVSDSVYEYLSNKQCSKEHYIQSTDSYVLSRDN